MNIARPSKSAEMRSTIIIVIAMFCAVYLLVSFVLWDLNVSNWTVEQRTIVAALGLPLSLGALVVRETPTK